MMFLLHVVEGCCITSLSVFFIIYYLLYSKILYDYIFISYSMFLVGFLDDLKINIKPFTRLIIMVLLLFLFIYILPIKIFNIDIPFLIPLMSNHVFSSFFVLLCFLFVINGANLIDGFNGLLAINLIIINIILTYLNMNNNNLEFSILLISQIIILFIISVIQLSRRENFSRRQWSLYIWSFDKFEYNNYKQLKPKDFFIFLLHSFILPFF